jgi:hypothetical protein
MDDAERMSQFRLPPPQAETLNLFNPPLNASLKKKKKKVNDQHLPAIEVANANKQL